MTYDEIRALADQMGIDMRDKTLCKLVQAAIDGLRRTPDERPRLTGNYLYSDGAQVDWCFYSASANEFFIERGLELIVIKPKYWRVMPRLPKFLKLKERDDETV